jgi:hypothetical protein
MSPCQVPSGLRRMTLTTPSILARSELVAQWAKAVNLTCIPNGIRTRAAALKGRLDQ